jgi:ribose transport system substrate-binding protein
MRRHLNHRILLPLAALVLTATMLSSCRKSAMQVAVIPRATATTMWEAEHAGAQFAAAQHGIDLYWNAPTREEDVEGQIALVDEIIDSKYQGLVLAPDQPLALLSLVQRAVANGIPTVIVGSRLALPPGRNLSYIVNDDVATGRMAAAEIGRLLGGKGRVAVLGIDPVSTSALAILHAFDGALEKDYPQIVITERRAGSYNWTEADQIAEEILAVEPNLNAFFSLSPAGTFGAHHALERRAGSDRIKLVGFQQTPELMSLVRGGKVDALIAENTYQMGYQAIELLAANAKQGAMGRDVQLAPTLLTAENADSPEVQPLITTNWSHKN